MNMNEVADAAVDQVSKGSRKVSEKRMKGEVKWFNVESGYGFIHRLDTEADIFVHQTGIARNNTKQFQRSLRKGEPVELYVVEGEKGDEAHDVTRPDGAPVQGSEYASNRGRLPTYMRGGRGLGGYGMTLYGRGPGGSEPFGNYGYMYRGGPRGRPFRGRPTSRPFYPRRGRGSYRGDGQGENGDSDNHHDDSHLDYQHKEQHE